MSLEQTTELYASVLRQLLPEGVYDTAEMTHVADDIYAHAKALAQADIDAHRLLQVLETIPVDLLADYEREYGLPMQCMVPGSQTIEERIHVLRWIRQHRNVMNREYLEQILAIFGVTLVDVVKHRPMLCTALCNSPVNTERLRYKVLLRLQYPMTADMSCIIENYLPGYLRVEWVVDMPWGEWVLNAGYELSGDDIRYTAYKTNQRNYYDSYADFDLVTALVRSFHDTDMQQWQGFIDAADGLTGNIAWEVNSSGIQYLKAITPTDPDSPLIQNRWCWNHQPPSGCGITPSLAADALKVFFNWRSYSNIFTTIETQRGINYISDTGSSGTIYITLGSNPNYNPSLPVTESYIISFENLAKKILANIHSASTSLSLHAENYTQYVANSIFETDTSKHFIKLSEISAQFELNKIFRA